MEPGKGRCSPQAVLQWAGAPWGMCMVSRRRYKLGRGIGSGAMVLAVG